MDPPRRVAWQVLRSVSAEDAYANLVLPRLLRQEGLAGRDARFATELAYGALRGRGSYDPVLAACLDRPLAEVDPAVLDALRLGAHQLLRMRVPPHAAVAATVDLVRAEIGQGAAGFANAVLRRVAERDLDGWLAEVAPDAAADPDGHLAVAASHPEWIIRALRDALLADGRERGELPDLLAADNAPAEVTLAALPGLATAAQPDQPDQRELAGARPGRWSPVALRLESGVVPAALPGVRAGRLRVQDEGSQLVALALAGAPLAGADGGQWLDLCAGPGGKAALLGALLAERVAGGNGLPPGEPPRLVAVEVAEHRAQLIRGSTAAVAEQLPIEVRTADGRQVGAAEPDRYDRVLVDAPCTGLGALRRRPEARWRRAPADLPGLTALQRELLDSALDAVRPGGVVGYATCSPHRAETRSIVDAALRRRADVERLDAREVLRSAVGDGVELPLGDGPDVQLWPHVHGTDAMYFALLRKR